MDDVLASINRHVDPFNHTVQPAIGRHGSSTSKPVRIAILDSGFDRANWHIRNDVQRIQGFRSFVSGTDPLDLQDKIGHGTHVLGLLLKFATCAEVYVARVAKDKTFCRDNCDSITQVGLARESAVWRRQRADSSRRLSITRSLNGKSTSSRCRLASVDITSL